MGIGKKWRGSLMPVGTESNFPGAGYSTKPFSADTNPIH